MYNIILFMLIRRTRVLKHFFMIDHLEMIPDILTVIEKMTKDEGIYFFFNVMYTFSICISNVLTIIILQTN